MKQLIIAMVGTMLLSSCVNYAEMVDRRQLEVYKTDKGSWGGMTVMRDTDYDWYYIIDFDGPAEIVSGSRLQLKEDIGDCIQWKCEAFLDGNYNSWIHVRVFYITDSWVDAYERFDRFTHIN